MPCRTLHDLARRCPALIAALLACAALPAAAADARPGGWPERPVRFIIPFPPGGANDFLARAIGDRLRNRWGQPFIIDNRGGAGGVLGTSIAAKAAADGYTIVLVPATHAINVSLYRQPPYDAVKDFAPIAIVAAAPYMLVANTAVPARTLRELIALAKAKPGQVHFGSAGMGNATHLMGELLKRMAGIDIVHVPYKGGAPAMADLLGGQIQLYFGSISLNGPLVKAGRIRPIATTGLRRSSAMPEVPTFDEAGVPGYDAEGWWGVLAPARTPAAIVNALNREILSIMASDEVRQWMLSQGFEPAGGSPADAARHIDREITKWRTVVEASGAKME